MNALAALALPSLALANNIFDHTIQPRIAGGFPGGIGAYPFFCHAITNETVCGGTLVAPDVVLTVKSCEDVFRDNEVFIGSNDRLGRDFAPRINVSSVTTHPTEDLMLVLLQEQSSNTIVTINADPTLPVDQTLFTIGFGKTAENDLSFSDALLEVDMFLLENGICRLQVGNIFNATTQACASFPFGGPCDGDEGAPLLDLITQVQYGVYSFNLGCTNRPSVFIRLSSYADWINDFICSNSMLPPVDICGETPDEKDKKSKKSKGKKKDKGGKGNKGGKSGKSSKSGKGKSKKGSVDDELEDYFYTNSTHYFHNETHYHDASTYNNETASDKSSKKSSKKNSKKSFKKGDQQDGSKETVTRMTHQQRNRRKRRQKQYPRIRQER